MNVNTANHLPRYSYFRLLLVVLVC